jgi:hypothetical protein
LPRYSAYSGAGDFTTIGMEVTDYEQAIVNVWRGPLIGTTPTFGVTLEESTDQQTWTTCAGTMGGSDPGSGFEAQLTATLKKRWFRIKVTLGGTNPVATCWALGFLMLRES